ncbi:DUF3899 domain-containing protein [Aquibacillus albus]|uniref:DUF3899 domain-containing protein n=1 Tax=Aquibacillus albus TaxID=1168171 RepID=UPI003B833CC2
MFVLKVLNNWVLLFFHLLCSLFIFVLTTSDFELVDYINILFYFGLIYLGAWLLLFIIKGRFFDGLAYGFRKVSVSFKRTISVDWEDKSAPSERISNFFMRKILFQGLSLTIIMFFLLCVYYL